MSILVQIMQEPAMIEGEIEDVGETARVPNAIAIGWKAKGRAIDASGEAHIKDMEERSAKREHSKAEIEKRDKGNKARR